MNQRELNDLDRHITGNWGEDSVTDVKVETSHDSFGWIAVTANYDGPGSPIGTGKTEQEAIDDLMEQLEGL